MKKKVFKERYYGNMDKKEEKVEKKEDRKDKKKKSDK